MGINTEQRILELERLVQELQAKQNKLKSSIKEPENPNIDDEWYNPLTQSTQVWNGKNWVNKSTSNLGPLKAGAASAYTGPSEGSYTFKVTDLGVVYITNGEITASILQNKASVASRVKIDANGLSVTDSGGNVIIELKPTGLFIGNDKIRVGNRQILEATNTSLPTPVGYSGALRKIPVRFSDGTTYNFLIE